MVDRALYEDRRSSSHTKEVAQDFRTEVDERKAQTMQ